MPRKNTSSTSGPSAPGAETPPPLAEFLEDFVTDELLGFQASGARAVRDSLVDLIHPQRSQVFDLLGQANARMNVVHGKLQEESRESRLYPWVFPPLAAVLFEGVFESCAGVWLLAGDSEDPSELKPTVADCIRLEVRAFVAAVGGKG
jgi:hypothetical protein